jgi:toxin-antitoxin system PIN domain toxin
VILPDVNVLVHAFRKDASDHAQCRPWLERVLNGESRYGMSPQVLSSLVRITTHPKVFKQPSPVSEALRFGDLLLAQPNCVVVQPAETHWQIFTRLCREIDARGNLVPDAWFAAMAIEAGCEWITLDRDYARFPGLKWRAPT